MNNYITFDGKKYKTKHGDWVPKPFRPRTVRVTAGGSLDATFGPSAFNIWQGKIIAPVTPDGAGWGSVSDLRASMLKASSLSMTDHYGTAYTVVVVGGGEEESRSPMWDAASNEFLVNITLKGAAS